MSFDFRLSIVQISMGVLCILCGIIIIIAAATTEHGFIGFISHGIWIGVYVSICLRSYLVVLWIDIVQIIYFFFTACFTCTRDSIELVIGAHGTDVSVGVRLLSGETLLQAKNSIGRTRTQVLADSMTIAASAKPLHHLDPRH